MVAKPLISSGWWVAWSYQSFPNITNYIHTKEMFYMSNRTENVLADLATLFNSHADKVQAVPSVTALDLDAVRKIIKEEVSRRTGGLEMYSSIT